VGVFPRELLVRDLVRQFRKEQNDQAESGRVRASERSMATFMHSFPAGLMLVCEAAVAQSVSAAPRDGHAYPDHELRFIVPFPPGGGNDVVGRIVARKLQEAFGRDVIVDNRGAAGGTVGTDIAAKSAPDGHTLLINNISLAVNATLFPKLPYDTRKDLAPVSIVGSQTSVLLVSPGLEAKSVRELIDLARRKPGQLIYGSGGPGSSSHLATGRLEMATGTRMTHVPYKGLAQAVAHLAGGRVEMVIATASTVLPLMGSGRMRALAVTTPQRSTLFPELPTMIEAGVLGYEVSTWYALLVPARTPRRIVARLNGELERITAAPDVRAQFAQRGLETSHTTPAQARAYISAEIESWGKVVRTTGVKPQ
jgi:tripartite-type tricarboxylate transporter receptor subunit TctC